MNLLSFLRLGVDMELFPGHETRRWWTNCF